MNDDDEIAEVPSLIPGEPRRKVHRDCRDNRFPGAFKIGRRWFISRRDWREWIASQSGAVAVVPTDAEVNEMLRRAGYAA